MNTILKEKKRLIIVLCSIVLLLGLGIGGTLFWKYSKADSPNPKETETTENKTDFANIKRDTTLSVKNGILEINRTEKSNEPMGEDGTWTIFIYVCGSNLEQQYQAATNDFKEIMSANFNKDNLDDVNIIIQTGGCIKWHSDNIATDKIQRYKINGSNNLELLETLDNSSTGSPQTLYEFLDWGVTNYPAKRMATIFWDHGSGPLTGVCQDIKYSNDGLTLQEMEYAFAKLSPNMSSKFEFIGFDACLSGSIEYANALAPYSNYMIASSETEPGEGWHYTPFLNHILKNPNCDMKELGKIICDSYGEFFSNNEEKNKLTLSLYDLSKVDNAMIEINYLTKYLSDAITKDKENIKKILYMLKNSVLYGKSNELVDIGCIINYLNDSNDFNYDVTHLKKAFDEFVCYNFIHPFYEEKDVLGVSIYMPSTPVSYTALTQYRNACFSPYHMELIEKIGYGCYNRDWSKFISYDWTNSPYFYETNFGFLNYTRNDIRFEPNLHKFLITINEYVQAGFIEAWYTNFSIYSPVHAIKKTNNTNIDKNTTLKDKEYSLTINKDFLDYVDNVYYSIFTKDDDNLLCLGENNKVNFDSKTGEVTSTFNKEWFILPDGQYLTTYIDSYDKETKTTIYAFPVLIDDIESTIKISETPTKDNKDDYTYECLGVWDATLRSDTSPRGYLPLKPGTTITPIYDIYNEKDNTFETEYGKEYKIKSDFDFLFSELPKGDYTYNYAIECINGETIYSDPIEFEITD